MKRIPGMAGWGASDRRAWGVALLVGVVCVGFVFLLFRVPAQAPPRDATSKPSVGVVALGGKSGDPLLAERAALFDPTPLFLPTEWSSAHREFTVNEPGGTSRPYPEDLTFAVSALALDVPSPIEVPGSPAESLAGDPPGAPFLGFGRTDVAVGRLPARGAFVEIVEAGSGRSVFARPVPDAKPPGSAPWQPMEFLAAVDAAGLVGPLVPTLRSGVYDVDLFFQRYLAGTLRVGSRLPPGFYRITVGP